jgi:hypothetical protein
VEGGVGRWHWVDQAMAAAVGMAMVAMTLLGGYGGWQLLWPVERWYDLRKVAIADAAIGDTVTILIERVVNHQFTGRYNVVLLDVTTGQVVCEGGDETVYSPARQLPPTITLDWWTDGAEPPCQEAIQPGTFQLETCVQVMHSIPLIGRREDCATSNVFKISAREVAP